MTDRRDRILNEFRSCVRRGLPLPARPDPIDLYDALGGDGYMALLAMIEYVSAEQEIKVELQQERARGRRVLADLAA